MLDKLKKICEDYPIGVITQVLKSPKNKELHDWIITQTDPVFKEHLVKMNERVFYLLNLEKGKSPICQNNQKKLINKQRTGYRFCSLASGAQGITCKCYAEYRKSNPKERGTKNIKLGMEKRKQTNLEKYGTENVMQVNRIKEKQRNTINSNDYTDIFEEKSKKQETNGMFQVINRVSEYVRPKFNREDYIGSFRKNEYDWECVKCDLVFKSHIDYGTIPKCPKCYPKTKSSGELELGEFIKSLGFDIIRSTKKIISPLELDIYIETKKIAIEFNGIYWHSTSHKEPTYHVDKYLQCKAKGIHLVQVFSDDWENKNEIVKNRIMNILGVSEKIHARKCIIKDLTSTQYKTFCSLYHLRGHAPAKYKYGLFHDDTLVAVMSFGKPRYSSEEYELIRYCSKNTIIGGAGKLFSYFVKKHSPKSILSYADRCWSNGNLYHALGFEDITEDERNIGYFYVYDNMRYHRSNFTKKKLVNEGNNPALTENEIMQQKGFLKIYDCGNCKFIWKETK